MYQVSSVVTNVQFGGVFDTGGSYTCVGAGDREFLFLPFNFSVHLKLLWKTNIKGKKFVLKASLY